MAADATNAYIAARAQGNDAAIIWSRERVESCCARWQNARSG
jgi:hypothetical protein